MARQVLIVPGVTAEDSTPLLIAAGSAATVGMYAPVGVNLTGKSTCHVMIETPGEPNILRTFKGTYGHPFAVNIPGPCTVFGRRPVQEDAGGQAAVDVGMYYDDGIGSP